MSQQISHKVTSSSASMDPKDHVDDLFRAYRDDPTPANRNAFFAALHTLVQKVAKITVSKTGGAPRGLANDMADELVDRYYVKGGTPTWIKGRYDPGKAKLRTWLSRIFNNLRNDWWRAHESEKKVGRALEAKEEGHNEHVPVAGIVDTEGRAVIDGTWDAWQRRPGLETNLDGQQRARRIDGALADLPEAERNVVLLRQVEDLTWEEAAAVLGVCRETVKRRYERAEQALQENLQDIKPGG